MHPKRVTLQGTYLSNLRDAHYYLHIVNEEVEMESTSLTDVTSNDWNGGEVVARQADLVTWAYGRRQRRRKNLAKNVYILKIISRPNIDPQRQIFGCSRPSNLHKYKDKLKSQSCHTTCQRLNDEVGSTYGISNCKDTRSSNFSVVHYCRDTPLPL